MSIFAPMLIVLILVIIIKAIQSAVESKLPSSLGKAGELEVSHILHTLPEEYLILDDAIIPDQVVNPAKKYTTQIDHVVVSPYGIFVIETKNYSGWIFGSEKSKRWKETFKTTQGHYFYNPIKQNWGHAYALAEHLHLNIGIFKPIVVFSDECDLHVDSEIPVVYMSQLKNQILNYTQEIIPRQDVHRIYNRLCNLNLVVENIENQHIDSIEERHTAKETVVRKRKCPRCGGELRLRNGKYGQFYGCSNYPNCRFTQDI